MNTDTSNQHAKKLSSRPSNSVHRTCSGLARCLGAICFILPGLALAATLTVTTTADTVANDGQCSLREAVIAANTNTRSGATAGECVAGGSGTDTITFGSVVAGGTITLSSVGDISVGPSALLVNSNLVIDGGAAGVTITRGTPVMRLIHLASGKLSLRQLTLSNGLARGYPGGKSVVGGFGGGSAGLGGAIYSDGTLLLEGTTLSSNQAIGGAGGGGSTGGGYGAGGGGGGLAAAGSDGENVCPGGAGGAPDGGTGGTSGSIAGGAGGAGGGGGGGCLLNDSFGTGGAGGFAGGGGGGSGDNSSPTPPVGIGGLGGFGGGGGGGGVSGNRVGLGGNGGLGAGDGGNGSSTGLFFGGGGGGGGAGFGGAVFVHAGLTTIRASTLSSNIAKGGVGGVASNTYGSGSPGGTGQGGGGAVFVYTDASLQVENTTVSGNQAVNGAGGGFFILGASAQINNATIVDNQASLHNLAGGGIAMNGSGATPFTLSNSIVANNLTNDLTVVGTVTSNSSNNLIRDQTGFSGGIVSTADPLLGPLANNGGYTQTRLPGAGSPTIDAGNNSTCLATDQRGVARPQFSGCDIGAVEFTHFALSIGVAGNGSVSAAASPAPFSGGITSCSSAGGSNCAASYAEQLLVSLTASAGTGQHFESWNGDCSGITTSISVSMDANKSCIATFATNMHTIGGTVSGLLGSGLVLRLNGGGDLSISGDGGFSFNGTLNYGSNYAVTVHSQPATPAQACVVSNGSGTLGDADITNVAVQCSTITHTVTGTLDSGQGTITPSTQSVDDGQTASLTVAPAAGWFIDSVSGCNGSLSGTTYTTSAITANCSVIASFAIDQHTVTPSVSGGNGTIDPATPQSVDHDATTSFTLTPDAHYHLDGVIGSCGGNLAGDIYTTDAITADCDVVARFAINTHTVGGNVSGLIGSDLVLRLNGSDPLLLTQDGSFVFAHALDDLSAYAVSIAQQPTSPNQVCSITDGSGLLDGSDISNVAIICADTTPQLSVSVTDNSDYARYGKLINYLVTVSNDGNGDATDIRVSNLSPAQLDTPFTSWTCNATGGGAICGSGTGALDDSGVAIPIGRSLTWLVTVPVLTDAVGDSVDYTVDVSGPATASATDSDILVILRMGFDVPYGNGAENVIEPTDACLSSSVSDRFDLASTYSVMLDAVPARSLIDSVFVAHDRHAIGFRIERLNLDAISQVRIVTIDANGVERASEWASTSRGRILAIATVTAGGQSVLLVEGADTSLSLPLPQAMDANVTVRDPATACD